MSLRCIFTSSSAPSQSLMRFLVVVRFASCSEDSLPLSYMHQFYSGSNSFLHAVHVLETCLLVLLRQSFCGLFMCIMCSWVSSISTMTIFGHFSLWILLYACKLKLKFLPCCTLSLRGDVKDILDLFLVKAQVQYFVCKLSKLFVLQSS